MHVALPRNATTLAAAVLPALAVGLAFWANSWGAAGGFFPAPLDDVYIHFDFARSLATGHGLVWVPGNGYSSGETAPLYAVVLALGHLAGFRGPWLGLWSAAVAILATASLLLSVRTLVMPCRPWVAWSAPLLVLSSALVDWSLFSGMEVALHGAVLGRVLVALDAATSDVVARRRGKTREAWQWRVGFLASLLLLLRPESVVLVPVAAAASARAVGRRSPVLAALRVGLLPVLVLGGMLGVNVLATGDARAAGAQLKLLSSNPFLGEVDRARAFVENLVTFAVKVLAAELGRPGFFAWALPVLVVAATVARRSRPVAVVCLSSAVAWTLLASWNGNAPFHNFRYYAPPLLMLLVTGALGVGAVSALRASRAPAAVLAGAALASGLTRLPGQLDHFRRCVANVRGQQVEVGLRVAALTSPSARILVGDAGAIPYVSGRAALDALGLGGFRALPFARAAVNGEASVVELLERVAPHERPTHLALYPNWFGAITSRFGREIARVTIEDNVICGGPVKVLYDADWSALREGDGLPEDLRGRVVDEIDVADVVSEAAHDYRGPFPAGGWTVLDVLADAAGERRFDGGRIVPEHARESFVVRRATEARAVLAVRTDASSGTARAWTSRRPEPVDLVPDEPTPAPERWQLVRAELGVVAAGDVVTIEAASGAFRDHHAWIVRSE